MLKTYTLAQNGDNITATVCGSYKTARKRLTADINGGSGWSIREYDEDAMERIANGYPVEAIREYKIKL